MIEAPSGRLQVDVHLTQRDARRSMMEDVRRGLTANPKYLQPKYFYDAAGSALFDRITELPEYYLTWAERGLLASIAAELMAQVRPQELVELGSGSSSKTRLLLDAGNSAGHLVRYVPFDVMSDVVRATASALLADYPSMSVHGVIGDFERHMGLLPPPAGRRMVLFLGSTIGNLDGPARRWLLEQIRLQLEPGDSFLLGVDLVKEVSVLEAAYNDSAGVTAEFNRNILRVMNNGLGADFRPEAYRHHAFYNQEEARIEMHLYPGLLQRVHVADLDLAVDIGPDEGLWTENSYKFTRESAAAMLEEAGLPPERWYADQHGLFGLALSRPG